MKKLSRRHKTILIHVCVGLVVIAVILFCRNFRYYSAETVRQIFDEYDFLQPYFSDSDGSAKAIIAHHQSSDFLKKCVPGMTYEEMIDLFGRPHAYYGSGFRFEVYFTTDGYYVHIYCLDDVVDKVAAVKIIL